MAEFFQKLFSIIISILTALGIITPQKEEKKQYSETLVTKIACMDNLRQVEGGCTDGRYVYEALIDPDCKEYEVTPSKIIKIDTQQDWKIVKTSEESTKLNHINDMTYNAADGTLMSCNNNPNYTVISIIDTDTLKLVKTVTVSQKLYAIVYVQDVDSNCYYCGISYTYNLVKYDKDFNELGIINLTDNGLTRQGIDAHENCLYLPYTSYDEETKIAGNYIYGYAFDGIPQGSFKLSNTSYEAENLFFIDNVMYVTYNIRGKGNGGEIYKIENYEFK